MKRSLGLIVGSLFVVCALAAGGQEKDKEKPPPKQQRYHEPLYPLQKGFRWYYRVTDVKGSKSPDAPPKTQQTVVTAHSEQTFSVKKKKAAGEDAIEEVIGFNLQVVGGGPTRLEQVLITEEGVYRVGGAGKAINPPLRILKTKAQKGDTWKTDSQSENAQLKGEFIVDVETVKVPAGEFKDAIVVRSRDFQIGAEKMLVETWYSPQVGMVKQNVQVGNHHVMMELEKVEAK